MGFSIIKPSPILAPYIKYFWSMESSLKPGTKHVQRIIPNGFLEWTFYLRDVPVYLRPGNAQKSFAMINGQQYGYYDIEIRGHLDLFSIVFTPFGAKLFFDFPLSELTDLSISADLVDKHLVEQFSVGLCQAKDLHCKKEVAEEILSRVATKSHSNDLDRLIFAFKLINRSKGQANILDLASNVCLSRKQFERNFKAHVGISPKKYLKIVRFQYAIHIKELLPEMNLTELAMTSNYYDQSHMISDFKHFSGLSPKDYFSDCSAYSDYFN